MPPINQAAAIASVGIIAVSVAAVAAIAIYESPEVRRRVNDIRQRIALAFQGWDDEFDDSRPRNPNTPRFNRPEDAHGFYQSRADVGVDADEETKRRQREELMYWNAKRAEMMGESGREPATTTTTTHRPTSSTTRGSSFDDFLSEDTTAGPGTFVYNTGTDVRGTENDALRRRGAGRSAAPGVRGLTAAMILDPFSDEFGIELDERINMVDEETRLMAPSQDEMVSNRSDIYNATPTGLQSPVSRTLSPEPRVSVTAPPNEVLFDFETNSQSAAVTASEDNHERSGAPTPTTVRSTTDTLERDLDVDEYMTAGQDDRSTAYASIQEWAQGSSGNAGFYSPLPVTPTEPMSEAEMVSAGQLTPVDTMSLADSGEHIENSDAVSSRAQDFDDLSDSDDGIATPGSWSDVGSVISETDEIAHQPQHA
ncbi:hypothetical protein GE21DRAFT_5723 [Neurospora crassa]|uniref:Uncharacterized protein n=1 Tax=Neurospora crassa (strain ATCC 24698 / 74-OR23-1A / CBS 708.71 / DSM 1257 / FGSC 987) TaxID=367110 RepID=V5IM21_NEUCR|nr:hypothetical protein NCU07695 [Neurospora crassa OR74A]ESA42843.1 hypothetical protein NCU07695 [Neurospora crassa OR74A]KHE84771.1 hypothetical protein GE21DRAFT_5723 [Neurospora crassa]|eukprot:XP_011394263.1 hypothetical protein NCU07695 [Neurospora crassa OR74A]